jgi:hypothetical protein
MSRLMRFALPAADIIEVILNGREPSAFQVNNLTNVVPADLREAEGEAWVWR